MMDHYGNEHYCPLTLVRVMGNVVIDDVDEAQSEDQEATGEGDEVSIEVAPKIQTDWILTKAKDMFAKIVQRLGVSQREDGVRRNKTNVGIPINNGDRILLESPCYLVEFLATNNQNYFHNISSHFLQIKYLQQYATVDSTTELSIALFNLPFPSQIRAEYFALSEWIINTKYSFSRLYHSFVNISTSCSDQCLSRLSLHDFIIMFKCHHVISMLRIETEVPIRGKGNIDDVISSANYLQNVNKNYTGRDSFDDKLSQQKSKSGDIFGNKYLSNSGNNVWNYALMKIRNLTKDLEINVSVSMTYLEEWSRNYKRQTDGLKKTQLVMASNVTRLENIINGHKQESRRFLKLLGIQLSAIIIVLNSDLKDGSKSIKLSSHYEDCVRILEGNILMPSASIFDSTLFLTAVNVSLSLLVNAILLAMFYNKIRHSILDEVTKVLISEDQLVFDKRTSIEDNTFQIVHLPRGVRIYNFPDCDYYSDDDKSQRTHRGLGALCYPIQPSVNFVTPTKDIKKKRKK